MQGTDPILSERTSRYKRNSLILSIAAILAAMISDASLDKAKIFELTLGPHIWWVGATILIYNLFWLALLSRQDFVTWDGDAAKEGFKSIYGNYRMVGSVRISRAFRPKIFWSAITCRVSAEVKADGSKSGRQKIASTQCTGQYLMFVLFDIGLTAVLALFALIIASGKTWSSFAPVSWGFC